jgi:L-rhamnose isomerase
MANRKVSEKIPAVSLDSAIGDQILEALQHDRYKEKIHDMIVAYTGTVEFEELVMKYAGKEYENRLLKSGRFWVATVVAAVITSAISAGVAILLTHK